MALDPEQERQRLARLYSSMTPEEMEEIANDAPSLTEIAREALKAEIARRELAITVDEIPVDVDEVEGREMVRIRRFLVLPEALLAKSRLESAGIECILADDNMVRINWPNLLGGVGLLVNGEDAVAATAILDEPIPDTVDFSGVEDLESVEPEDSESS